jgi:hypothetical protein
VLSPSEAFDAIRMVAIPLFALFMAIKFAATKRRLLAAFTGSKRCVNAIVVSLMSSLLWIARFEASKSDTIARDD